MKKNIHYETIRTNAATRQRRLSLAFVGVLTLALLIIGPIFFFVLDSTPAGIGALVGLVLNVTAGVLVYRGIQKIGSAIFLSVDLLIVVGVGLASAASGEPYAPAAVSVMGLILAVLIPTGLLVTPFYTIVMVAVTGIGFGASIFISGDPVLMQRLPVFAVVFILVGGIIHSLSRIQTRTMNELDSRTQLQQETLSRLEHVISQLRDLSRQSDDDQRDIQSRIHTVSSLFSAYREGVAALHENSMTLASESGNAATGLERLEEAVSKVRERSESQLYIVTETAQSQKELSENMARLSSHISTVEKALRELEGEVGAGRERVDGAIEMMKNLAAQREQLQKSIPLIAKIAAQTNLLAMNAAIEAAHAGDAGKGFAVVAEEVRNLADESSRHTKTIDHAVKAINAGVEQSVEMVQKAGSVFQSVRATVDQSVPTVVELQKSLKVYQEQIGEMKNASSNLEAGTKELRVAAGSGQESVAAFREIFSHYDSLSSELSGRIDTLERRNTEVDATLAEAETVQKRMEQLNEMITRLLGSVGGGQSEEPPPADG